MKAINYCISLSCCCSLALLPGQTAAGELLPIQIFSNPQAIAALTAGEFDPAHDGNEVASLLADGSVVELTRNESGWVTNTIFTYTGEIYFPWEDPRIVSLNLGDVMADRPGNEIVLSFQKQIVAIYRDAAQGWTNQVIADFSESFGTPWAANVGDGDPSHPGDEVFSIFEGTFDFSSGIIRGNTGTNWSENEIYSGEVGMDAAIGDSNPDVPGNEIIVVTEMGPAYEIFPPSAGGPGLWPKRIIWDDYTNAGWVVQIADVERDLPGNELVYGTRYSDRILMSWHNGTNLHEVRVLFTGVSTNGDFNNMLDVATGHVFSNTPSAEIFGVDVSGSVYMVQEIEDEWHGSTVWRDTNALLQSPPRTWTRHRATKWWSGAHPGP